MGVCSDYSQTAQQLQISEQKLKTLSGMILNGLQPKFAAKTVANEKQCLKNMSWFKPALTGQALTFHSNITICYWENLFILYWTTINNLISNIFPKFRVLSSHFSEVNCLLHEHWVKPEIWQLKIKNRFSRSSWTISQSSFALQSYTAKYFHFIHFAIKSAKRKYFNYNLCPMQNCMSVKALLSRIMVYLIWPWYSTWAI